MCERKPVSLPPSSPENNMTSLLSRVPVLSIFQKCIKKTSIPLFKSINCAHRSSVTICLKVCHQCVYYWQKFSIVSFGLYRPVKFWIRVESLANLFIYLPGYLNIILCLWESVSQNVLFLERRRIVGSVEKKTVVLVIHSFREKCFPWGKGRD